MLLFLISFLKILFGQFIPNKKYTVIKKFLQVISRFTWEIIQTSIGLIVSLFILFIGRGKDVIFSNGAIILRTKGKYGGFTIGNYIVADNEINGNPNQRLFQHEYGHYLQSIKCGPVYLFKYGIPSLISSWRNDYYGHAKHPVEQDANIRAKSYWDKYYQQSYLWDLKYNPIYKELKPAYLKWYDFIPVYFPLIHLVKAFKK